MCFTGAYAWQLYKMRNIFQGKDVQEFSSSAWNPNKLPPANLTETKRAKDFDEKCLVVFPILFASFNLIYWLLAVAL